MTESSAPLVTVVTPSFNQASFLRQTIESVLAQDYPNLEYLVIDGGSTDGSRAILDEYAGRLHYVSEADRGQTDAINKGFRRARGEILAWLNSDDVYLPGAVSAAVRELRRQPGLGWVYGHGRVLNEQGGDLGRFPGTEPFSPVRLLQALDFVLQPTAFFRNELVKRIGYLDETLEFAMDWDLWIRLAAQADVGFLDRELACTREYGRTKTSTGGFRRIRELGRLAERHVGKFWTPGVRMYAIDTATRGLARWPSALAWPLRRLAGLATRRSEARVPQRRDGRLRPVARLMAPGRWKAVLLRLEIGGRTPATIRLTCGARREVDRTLTAARPGLHQLAWELPSDAPFVEFQVASPPGTSVRCVGLGPAPEGRVAPGESSGRSEDLVQLGTAPR